MSEPFVFYAQEQLVVLTGRRAKNLPELLAHLQTVPEGSVFYHTHDRYRTSPFGAPKFFNEFAEWVSESLLERRLGEQIDAIDLRHVTSLRKLREAISYRIERHLKDFPGNLRECPPGEEFQFCEARSFVYPSGAVAHTVGQFFQYLPTISNASLYFHLFESRLRSHNKANNFSDWLSDMAEKRLARSIEKLNPYDRTLDELKARILRIGRRHVRIPV